MPRIEIRGIQSLIDPHNRAQFLCIIFTLATMFMAILGAYITFIVYLGIFAFNNPDNEAWIGNLPKEKNVLFPTYEQAFDSDATHVLHISDRFRAWFQWGFVTCIVPISFGVFHLTGILVASIGGENFFAWINALCGTLCGVATCLATCSCQAWLIAGLLWRFSSSGRTAAGAYKPESVSKE